MAAQAPLIPEGTVCVLVTGDDRHAIPVSTTVVVGDEVRFALGKRRGSLERLPGPCSLCVVAEGVAVTVYGTARSAGEVEGVVAVRMSVDRVEDHMTPQFRIDAGVAWAWTDAAAEARDRAVRAGLAE